MQHFWEKFCNSQTWANSVLSKLELKEVFWLDYKNKKYDITICNINMKVSKYLSYKRKKTPKEEGVSVTPNFW